MSSTTASLTPAVPLSVDSEETTVKSPSQGNHRRPWFLTLGAVVLILLATYGWRHLEYALAHVDTDDAEIDGDISPVLPRVSGYVTGVLVRDNQHVEAGQPLLEVDSRELDLQVAHAADAVVSNQAALATARATVLKTQAALAVARSSVAVTRVKQDKASADLKRDEVLFKSGAITDRQLSDSRAVADVAQAENVAALRQAEAAETEVAVAQAEVAAAAAGVRSRESELALARLQRSYAVLTAPIGGVVSRKNVELGQFVQAGQTLLSIASETGVWVVANYKETQLRDLRVGQPVDITVDAYPGVAFSGRVDSIGGATGARFALLPPDNASGNYIKVTQRVPVKILFVHPPADRPLRAGLSVDAAVRIKA